MSGDNISRGVLLVGSQPTNLDTPPALGNNLKRVAVTANGHLLADVVIDGPGGLVITGQANNADNVAASALLRNLPTISYSYVWDGSNWDRLRGVDSGVGNFAPSGTAQQVAAYIMGWDGSSQWKLGIQSDTGSFIAPNGGLRFLQTISECYFFDGTNYVRGGLASAANLALQSGLGVQLASGPGEWAIQHTPAVATQATISRAAVAASRHVCKGFSFTLNAVAAIVVPVQVVLRDGATGAGTVLWSGRYTGPAGTTIHVERDGLNLVGSVNTAMTMEFVAAPGAGDFQTVTLNGFTAA